MCLCGEERRGSPPRLLRRTQSRGHACRKKERNTSPLRQLPCSQSHERPRSSTSTRSPSPPSPPAAQILRRFIASHRIACVSPGFPAGGGFSDRRTLPAFPTRSRYGHFPFVVRRDFLLCVHGGSRCRSDVVVGLHCAGRDDRPRPRVGSREGRGLAPVVALRFRVALLRSALAPRPQIAGRGNGIWVNCVGHMHDASYSCPLIS